MSSAERCRVLVAAALIASVVACASNTAPKGFLPTPDEALFSKQGGWVDIEVDGATKRRLSGELLAASPDSLWVLAPDSAGFVVARRHVSGNLSRYKPEYAKVAGVATLGTLSAAMDGWFAVFTAPGWILTGTIAGLHDGYATRVGLALDPTQPPADVAAFARFPQGIPRGMDARYQRLP